MSITRIFLAPLFVFALLLGACTSADVQNLLGSKQGLGTIFGGAAGGLLGSTLGSGSGQTLFTIGGTLLGAFVGNEVGASLDRADKIYAGQAAQNALESAPSGQTVVWQNPDSGHYGTVTPRSTYSRPVRRYNPAVRRDVETGTSEHCREYQTTVTVGGKEAEGFGTACRKPDGSWEIQ